MPTNGDEITSIASHAPTLEAPVDEEIAAREANVRRWWRRAIALIIFAIIASPLSAFVAWQVHLRNVQEENKLFPSGAAGPPHRVLKVMYRQYTESEGPSRRGYNFLNLISWIGTQCTAQGQPFSEDALVFYCGEPDMMTNGAPNTKTYVYYYARSQPRDSCAICTFTSSDGTPFMLRQVSYNTAAAFNSSTKPTSTKPSATRPTE